MSGGQLILIAFVIWLFYKKPSCFEFLSRKPDFVIRCRMTHRPTRWWAECQLAPPPVLSLQDPDEIPLLTHLNQLHYPYLILTPSKHIFRSQALKWKTCVEEIRPASSVGLSIQNVLASLSRENRVVSCWSVKISNFEMFQLRTANIPPRVVPEKAWFLLWCHVLSPIPLPCYHRRKNTLTGWQRIIWKI